MNRKKTFYLLLVALIVFAGGVFYLPNNIFLEKFGNIYSLDSFRGKKIKGNGNIVNREISVDDFKNINAYGIFEIILTQSTKRKVNVEADENLFDYMKIESNGTTLSIGHKKGYRLSPSKRIVAYVSSKLFQDISLSGSGTIRTENALEFEDEINFTVSGSGNLSADINSKVADVEISGSGDVALKGVVEEVNFDVRGSGNVDSRKLKSQEVEVYISGSGDAKVYASKSISGRISGSGDVVYTGSPKEVNVEVSGSGSLTSSKED